MGGFWSCFGGPFFTFSGGVLVTSSRISSLRIFGAFATDQHWQAQSQANWVLTGSAPTPQTSDRGSFSSRASICGDPSHANGRAFLKAFKWSIVIYLEQT